LKAKVRQPISPEPSLGPGCKSLLTITKQAWLFIDGRTHISNESPSAEFEVHFDVTVVDELFMARGL
jgi:hypothetical protein